jgi:hypothetical protein
MTVCSLSRRPTGVGAWRWPDNVGLFTPVSPRGVPSSYAPGCACCQTRRTPWRPAAILRSRRERSRGSVCRLWWTSEFRDRPAGQWRAPSKQWGRFSQEIPLLQPAIALSGDAQPCARHGTHRRDAKDLSQVVPASSVRPVRVHPELAPGNSFCSRPRRTDKWMSAFRRFVELLCLPDTPAITRHRSSGCDPAAKF